MGWKAVAGILQLVGIGLAAYSAQQSSAAASASRDQSANSMLFQARLQGLRQYNDAYGSLDSAISSSSMATADVGVDLEEGAAVMNLSLDQYRYLSNRERGATEAFRKYETSVNDARGVWSKDVEAKIVHASEDAHVAIECYALAGNPPMNEQELKLIRPQLSTSCSGMIRKVHNFRDAANGVVNAMVTETQTSMKDLGVHQLN